MTMRTDLLIKVYYDPSSTIVSVQTTTWLAEKPCYEERSAFSNADLSWDGADLLRLIYEATKVTRAAVSENDIVLQMDSRLRFSEARVYELAAQLRDVICQWKHVEDCEVRIEERQQPPPLWLYYRTNVMHDSQPQVGAASTGWASGFPVGYSV